MEQKMDRGKLRLWQERLAQSDRDYGDEVAKMDERERIYAGDDALRPLVPGDKAKDEGPKRSSHVRNIVFENIESQISSEILQPKVTPRRRKDERLAAVIEHFLRNELDRLPFEMINDMAERTVPIQGGVGFLMDWDDTKRSGGRGGEFVLSLLHPKQFAPQPGIYSGVEDMDWFIAKLPTTKAAIRNKYGKAVYDESEAEPQIRGSGGEDHSEDAVTQYIGFERNPEGGIDRYSWVNDVELEDLEDHQARRQPVCVQCGRVRPLPGQVIHAQRQELPEEDDGSGELRRELAGREMARWLAERSADPEASALSQIAVAEPEPRVYDGGSCPWCGGEEFEDRKQDYEQVILPIETASGTKIPGAGYAFDGQGGVQWQPTKIPFYKPDVMPVVTQRSVSGYGHPPGNSDVDAIRDQQNTTNRLEQKIIDRLVKAGSRVTLPNKANLHMDPEDGERWYLDKPEYKAMIDVYTFSGDLQYELAYLSQVYEEARQILGITDAFQGRRDPTATSAVAKEHAAAQAAGRLESKRVMKKAAYAKIFELMFKYQLAYADEPIPVSYKNSKGETLYEEFDRYDFLEQDANGEWVWNDQFLFSCDTATPLASDRQALWQETRMNLQTGAFGDPAATETLILFWSKMEELHYPGAASTKKFLEEKQQRETQVADPQTVGMGAAAPAAMPQAQAPAAPL